MEFDLTNHTASIFGVLKAGQFGFLTTARMTELYSI